MILKFVVMSVFLETYVKDIPITATKWAGASEEKLEYICKDKLHHATLHNQYTTNSCVQHT